MKTHIIYFSILAFLASSCFSDDGSKSSEGDPNITSNAPELTVVPVLTPHSVSLDTSDRSLRVSASDVVGEAGCALAISAFATPPGNAVQLFFEDTGSSHGSTCGEGVYNISSDCDFRGRTCAEFRHFENGRLTGRLTASSGSVSVSRPSDGLCQVDFFLGFGSKGTYEGSFTIVDRAGRLDCQLQ